MGLRAGLDTAAKREIPIPCRDFEPPIIQPVVQRYAIELSRLLNSGSRNCLTGMLLCLTLRNSGALPPVHELFKRPSYLLRDPKKGSFETTVTQTLTT
jgi:hypothetical protein